MYIYVWAQFTMICIFTVLYMCIYVWDRIFFIFKLFFLKERKRRISKQRNKEKEKRTEKRTHPMTHTSKHSPHSAIRPK